MIPTLLAYKRSRTFTDGEDKTFNYALAVDEGEFVAFVSGRGLAGSHHENPSYDVRLETFGGRPAYESHVKKRVPKASWEAEWPVFWQSIYGMEFAEVRSPVSEEPSIATMLERIAAALEQIAASLVPLAVCAERETFIYELEQRLAERTHD